jgi:hypothetical protein
MDKDTLKHYVEKLGLDSKASISDRDKDSLTGLLRNNGECELAGYVEQLNSPAELEDLIVNTVY